MPRVPKGEMSLTEIRNLARQHNKLSSIKDIDKATRVNLIKQINKLGYEINHAKKMIKKRKSTGMDRTKSKIKVGGGGERKPQKATIKRKARAELVKGAKPVMKVKKKPPAIPANVKGKKTKPDRSKLIAGY
jgi:hypothetical protein